MSRPRPLARIPAPAGLQEPAPAQSVELWLRPGSGARTREVGLRQALGACPDDIRFLFLVESAALGLAGGIGGVLAGLLAGLAVPLVTGGAMQADPHPAHLAAALAFAVATGLAFGAYPAVKASRLAPADALRAQG